MVSHPRRWFYVASLISTPRKDDKRGGKTNKCQEQDFQIPSISLFDLTVQSSKRDKIKTILSLIITFNFTLLQFKLVMGWKKNLQNQGENPWTFHKTTKEYSIWPDQDSNPQQQERCGILQSSFLTTEPCSPQLCIFQCLECALEN